jgi:hypothetical protein
MFDSAKANNREIQREYDDVMNVMVRESRRKVNRCKRTIRGGSMYNFKGIVLVVGIV